MDFAQIALPFGVLRKKGSYVDTKSKLVCLKYA